MALTERDYSHQIDELLPRGPIWKRTPGGALDAVLYALGREAARVDARINQVIEESDPRTSIITGDFRCAKEWSGVPSATGAFNRVREEGHAPGGGAVNGCLIDFYASRVHSIYGSSSSVQPPAMVALILIKT